MAERKFTLPERLAVARALDEGLIPARTRRRAAKKLSREKVSYLNPLGMHQYRMHALRHLRNLDHLKHVQDGDPGFTLGEADQQPYEDYIPEPLRRYLPHPDVTPLSKPADEARLHELRGEFDKKANKKFITKPNEKFNLRKNYRWWKRAHLAIEIGTNYIGLTPAERIAALDKADYSEESRPINMKQRIATATKWGLGLFAAGEILRGIAASTNISSLLNKIPETYLNTSISIAVGLYTLSYAMECWTNARLTRELGTSASPLVTGMDAASKRLLSVGGRRAITIGTVTGLDMLAHSVAVNGALGAITSDPKKYIAACLLTMGLNLAVIGVGEFLIAKKKLEKKFGKPKQ